jgi:hypothetical protein
MVVSPPGLVERNRRLGGWVVRASPSGGNYAYWMPPMPRINDAYLDCVVYLYGSEADAEDGLRTGGSGFLIGIPTIDLPTNVWLLYAVTNRHVIEPDNLVIRFRTKDDKHFIMNTDKSAWHVHPLGDDIAVCLVSFDWKSMRYNFVPRERFLDKDTMKRYNIGSGDDVFVIGRFINHEGQQRNLPTVRFGCVAQNPWEPIKQDTGFEQESFLVEARSIAGYSGAPVFAYIPSMSERPDTEDWAPRNANTGNIPTDMAAWTSKEWGIFKSHGPWLLGVDWGHLHYWEPVRDESGRPVNPANPNAARVRTNTGMMAVVPAWKLIELLDEDTVSHQRKLIIEQIRTTQANNVATSD